MRAILLAAGLGTRLRPLTDSTPKCLAPINGKPLLGYWLDSFEEVGVGPILINLHHHADQVREFVEQRQDRDRIVLSYEKALLGTGGTIRANSDFCMNASTMMVHSDNFCMADLEKFIRAHQARPPGTEISMMTFISENPHSCGIVEVSSENVVTDFHEKVSNPPSCLANGAVYIFEPSVVKAIATMTSAPLDISRDVIPKYLGKIFAWPANAIHIDVGTPRQLERANQIMKERFSET